MPKAQKGLGVDKYPGLKEFATRVYRQTPSAQHDSLRLQLNYFVNQAKLTGEATKMNWTVQTMQTLAARFGRPAGDTPPPAAAGAPPRTPSPALTAGVLATQSSSQQSPGRLRRTGTQAPTRGGSHSPNGAEQTSVSALGLASTAGAPRKFNITNPLISPKSGLLKSRSAGKNSGITPSVRLSNRASSGSPAPPETGCSGATNKTATDNVTAGSATTPPHSAYGVQTFSASTSQGRIASENRAVQKGPHRELAGVPKKRQTKAAISERRRARFGSPAATDSPYMELHTGGPIVGTSQKLEKSYFRLTGQVNTSVVRPPEVIARALEFVYAKYEQDRTNYAYISDQLKALRQDLTVQHVVSALTVRVYECNARVSLEHDDLGEYNQCAAQLRALYTQAREPQHAAEAGQMLQNEKEFEAYVIYYKIYVGAWEELGVLLRELGSAAHKGTDAAPDQTGPVQMLARALDCVSIVTMKQNSALFTRWREATPLERKLLGKFAVREQLRALEAMARATLQQNQTLPLAFLRCGMGLASVDETRAFLDTWKVPHDGACIRSSDALPVISQAVAAVSGRADIKGQI